MKSVFVAVASLIAAVVAQNGIISVTSPLTATTYTAGQPAILSWVDPKVDVIPKIVLARGTPTALQPVSTIAENVDAKAGTYTWNVPADITPGNDYAFEFGVSPNLSFTGLFNIVAHTGNAAPAPAAVSSSSSVNTAAPSASVPVCTFPASASASASASAVSASATAHHKRSVDFESAGLKVSANQAAVGAIAVAGAAAVALF